MSLRFLTFKAPKISMVSLILNDAYLQIQAVDVGMSLAHLTLTNPILFGVSNAIDPLSCRHFILGVFAESIFKCL